MNDLIWCIFWFNVLVVFKAVLFSGVKRWGVPFADITPRFQHAAEKEMANFLSSEQARRRLRQIMTGYDLTMLGFLVGAVVYSTASYRLLGCGLIFGVFALEVLKMPKWLLPTEKQFGISALISGAWCLAESIIFVAFII